MFVVDARDVVVDARDVVVDARDVVVDASSRGYSLTVTPVDSPQTPFVY